MEPSEVLKIWGSKEWEQYITTPEKSQDYLYVASLALASNDLKIAVKLLKIFASNERWIVKQIESEKPEEIAHIRYTIETAIKTIERLRKFIVSKTFLKFYSNYYNEFIKVKEKDRDVVYAHMFARAEEEIIEMPFMKKRTVENAALIEFIRSMFVPSTFVTIMQIKSMGRKKLEEIWGYYWISSISTAF